MKVRHANLIDTRSSTNIEISNKLQTFKYAQIPNTLKYPSISS